MQSGDIERHLNSHSMIVKKAAEQRGIKFKSFVPSALIYELSLKNTKYLFVEGMCGLASAPAYISANRKNLSFRFLKRWGILVPETTVVKTYKECLPFLEKYEKVVIKPPSLTGGQGITAGVNNREMLKVAVDHVHKYVKKNGSFILQEFFEGDDYRVLVIGYEKIFCLKRIHAFLTGDGKSRIKDLIRKRKVTVGLMKYFLKMPHAKITIALQSQGLNMNSIPSKNHKVKLSTTANLHSGGFTTDKTDVVCKEAIDISKRIARKFVIPVLGVDFISEDISKSPGKVIELNPTPDLVWHTNPNFGKSHNPAEALIDFLFFSNDKSDLKIRAKLN